MKQNTPSYLVTNRLGIYYFSYRIPKTWQFKTTIIRKSLYTRDFKQAQKLTRRLMTFMDRWNDLAQKYFADEAEFKQAFSEYNKLITYEKDNAHDILERENALNEPEHIKQLLLDDAVIEYQEKNINLQLLRQLEIYNRETKKYPVFTYDNVSSQTQTVPVKFHSGQEDKPLLDVIVEYMEYRQTLDIDEKTKGRDNYPLTLFERIVNEDPDRKTPVIMCSELTHKHMKDYASIIIKMPMNVDTGIKKGKSISEILRLKLEYMAPKTHNDNIEALKRFLIWADNENYAIDNAVFKALKNIKTSKKPRRRRIPFTPEQLKVIFESDKYHNGTMFKRAADYWMPLILLYTGARMSEIIQAHVSDIYFDGDNKTWVFNVEELDLEDIDYDEKVQKILKTEGSKKSIPIHPQLIAIGLIKYRDYIESTGEYRLFPNDFRKDASANFTTFIESIEVTPHSKKMMIGTHSFRHGLKTKLMDLSVNDGLVDDIIGQTSKNRSAVHNVYTHTQRINEKWKAIKKVKFDNIDFKKICPWDKCAFHRQQFRKKD